LFVKREIEAAQGGEGPTVVDIITDIIRIHGPGGAEEEDGIELELALANMRTAISSKR
jgi:hypothetical protein